MMDKIVKDFQILEGKHIAPNYRRYKGDRSAIRGLVCAVLYEQSKEGIFIPGEEGLWVPKKVHETENIVTDAGDLFYAQRGALLTVGATIAPLPTNFTNTNGVPDMIMELYDNTGSAPAKGNNRSNLGTLITNSAQAMDGTYPLVNDGDGDNTGAGTDVITYRVSYTTANANGSIDDVILTNPTPGASEAILMHADGLAVTKTSSDTLKVFVNHTMNGV